MYANCPIDFGKQKYDAHATNCCASVLPDLLGQKLAKSDCFAEKKPGVFC